MALTKAHNRMIADAAVNVKDFGAVGDGVTDDTAAIRLALAAADDISFPAGYVFRITEEVVVADDKTLFGGGEIKVDQSPYVRGLRVGSNTTVRNLTFRGNGVATERDSGLTGGQMGLAVGSWDSSNIKVLNCQFYDFISDDLNTAAALVMFSSAHAIEVSGCYFDTSNDGFVDIDANYRAGGVIVSNNISYSNSDLFYQCASVGLGDKISGTDVEKTSYHIVTNNILIKNRWAPAPAGRLLGRHGIIAHYNGGISHLICTGNIIGNVARHGVYLRGSNTVGVDSGPNIISNNHFAYCGSGSDADYSSSIRCESRLPTIISNNYMEYTGYFPDGTDGEDLAYDIECVRGVTDLIIENNVMKEARGGSLRFATSTDNRVIKNLKITGNTIETSYFGVYLALQTTTATVEDVKILNNHITLTGENHASGVGVGIGDDINTATTVEEYSLQIIGNIIAGTGATDEQYGIAMMVSDDFSRTALVTDNLIRDVKYGIATRRVMAASVLESYIPHRILGTKLKWERNRIINSGTAFYIRQLASTILVVVGDGNIIENCTTTGLSQSITWNTANEGKANGSDSSGNLLVEFKASAIPTAQQYYQGDVIINTAPAASGNIGWVCVTSGTPGTWKTFGAISA